MYHSPLRSVSQVFDPAGKRVRGHSNANSTGLRAAIAPLLGDFGGGASRLLRYLHAISVAVHSWPTPVQRTPTRSDRRLTRPPPRHTANRSRTPPAQAECTANHASPTRA